MVLRDYQRSAVEKVKARYLAGVRRQLIKHATGLGKTILFAALPDGMGWTRRVLVVDHRKELTDQALAKITRLNPTRSVGVEMGPREALPHHDIVVAGVQSIGRKGSPRMTKFNPMDFDAVVIDEAHHATAQSYRTIIDYFTQNPKLLLLGVTATPNRADGKGLGEIFQEIVDDKGILWGIKAGWLADLRGVKITTGTDINKVRTVAEDFDQVELRKTVDTPSRNALIVRSFKEQAPGRKGIFFTVDVEHAQHLADEFNRQNVPATAVWGDDPDRATKLEKHRAGNLQVVTNCEVLTEGYDDWTVSCIGMTAPTQSEGKHTMRGAGHAHSRRHRQHSRGAGAWPVRRERRLHLA